MTCWPVPTNQPRKRNAFGLGHASALRQPMKQSQLYGARSTQHAAPGEGGSSLSANGEALRLGSERPLPSFPR